MHYQARNFYITYFSIKKYQYFITNPQYSLVYPYFTNIIYFDIFYIFIA